jgi:hypothetical protein
MIQILSRHIPLLLLAWAVVFLVVGYTLLPQYTGYQSQMTVAFPTYGVSTPTLAPTLVGVVATERFQQTLGADGGTSIVATLGGGDIVLFTTTAPTAEIAEEAGFQALQNLATMASRLYRAAEEFDVAVIEGPTTTQDIIHPLTLATTTFAYSGSIVAGFLIALYLLALLYSAVTGQAFGTRTTPTRYSPQAPTAVAELLKNAHTPNEAEKSLTHIGALLAGRKHALEDALSRIDTTTEPVLPLDLDESEGLYSANADLQEIADGSRESGESNYFGNVPDNLPVLEWLNQADHAREHSELLELETVEEETLFGTVSTPVYEVADMETLQPYSAAVSTPQTLADELLAAENPQELYRTRLNALLCGERI